MNIREDGSVFPVNLMSKFVEDRDGHPIAVVTACEDITERKRVEEMLRLKNLVFDASVAANSTADRQGIITEANNAFLTIWGYSNKDEVIGKPISDFLQHEQEAVAIVTALNTTGVWEGEYTAKRKDGSTFMAYGLATVLRDTNDTMIGYQSSVIDITDRKQAEEQIKASEEQYRLLIQNIHAGVVVHAPDTRILFNNQNASELLGLTEDQMLGKTAIDPEWHFLGEGNTPLPLERYPVNQVVSTLRPLENFVVGIHRPVTNDLIWVLVNAYPVFDEKKSLDHITVTFIDITTRKQAEETLRESEERFRATFEQAAVGIVHADPDGHFLRMNHRFCEIVGYRKEEMLTHTFQEMTHPDDLRSDVEYVRQLLAGEISTFSMEKRYIRKDGSVVWVNLTVSPVRNTSGAIQYVIGVVEDISARKRTENALKESHEELERRVTERTFDLSQANQQLQQEIEERTKTEAELKMFNEVMLDREERMIELKEEVNRLAAELGRAQPYTPVWEEEPE